MDLLKVKNCGLPFKASVESSSSLVGGDWGYLSAPEAKKDEFTPSSTEKKKSSIWKPILITVASLAVIATGLATARCKISGMDDLVKKNFSDVEGFGQKCKWVMGKAGQGVIDGYNATLGKLFGKIGEKAEKSTQTPPPPVPDKPVDSPPPPKEVPAAGES